MTSYNFLQIPKYITSRHWFLKPTLNLYVYLFSKATYIEKTTINNIVLNKHQILTSSKALESALKLTRKQVITALEHLKKTGDIKITATNKYSIITLLFEENDKQKTGDEPLEIESPNNSRKLKRDNKRDTSIDNIDNINNILVDFEEFWKNYPIQMTTVKGSKKNSQKIYNSLREKKITKEELSKALECYKKVIKTKTWQQSKRVEGWLRDWETYKQEDYSKEIEAISQRVKAIEPLASIQVKDKEIIIYMPSFDSLIANEPSIENDIKQHCKDIDFQYSFTNKQPQND